MVRMSKQKQDKLESIMNLVEQLGVDRVLGRLRQTKMMSKDVLDDMQEWETDYEKRVALLGFLVSPEGKRAFGALYELSKVHEEQMKLQEEQEKLRQEQLAQQTNADLRKFGRGKGAASTANMKFKLRAQMVKRREQQNQPQKPNNGETLTNSTPANPQQSNTAMPNVKSGKRSPMGTAQKKNGAKESEEFYANTEGETNNEASLEANGDGEKESDKQSSHTPTSAKHPPRIRKTSECKPGNNSNAKLNENGMSLSLTGSAVSPSVHVPQLTKALPPKASTAGSMSPQTFHPKALDDFSNAKARESVTEDENQPTDGDWGRNDSTDIEGSEEDAQDNTDVIEEDRPPPDGENVEDEEKGIQIEDQTSPGTSKKKVRIYNSVKVVEITDSPDSPTPATSTPLVQRRKLLDIHQKLLNAELTVDKLTMDQIKDIVAEWQIMKKEQSPDSDWVIKELQHAKDDLKKMVDEKDRIRKEKDRYVFKEFELQQKLQDLSQKYKSLRDDHESLKQGNYQIQQSTKKNNKVQQELRKKIAKLESKIKSMDKVTVRKATQTTEVFDKDVHEALRIAEESLQVAQAELKEALAKCKTAQQEADDLKKFLNAKGREINKRERKSKKDEETIRFITRERDAMENKLRKVSEQLEYYKGMMEIRTKGGKRQLPEKKEVRVQRCSSGRHVLVKTHASSNNHQHDDEADEKNLPVSRNGRNSLTNGNSARITKPATATTKSTEQPMTKSTTTATSKTSTSTAAAPKTTTSTAPTAKTTTSTTATPKTTTSTSAIPKTTTSTSVNTSSVNVQKVTGILKKSTPSSNTDSQTTKSNNIVVKTNAESVQKPNEHPSKSNHNEPTPSAPRQATSHVQQGQPTGNVNSPRLAHRQPNKSEEKLVRPKAATVRTTIPSNSQRK